jgi:putative membrane protein
VYIRGVATRFLDDAARAAFKRAVETVETASAVEVVVAVRRRSGGYRHVNVIVGALTAFAGLATMLYSSHAFQLSSILVDPFVVGILAGATVELLPQVKRWLTPRAWRRAHVERAARAAFIDRGVHNTTGRSGLLVYISWLERVVALIPDSGLARELPPDLLPDAAAQMSDTVAQGGVAVARGVESLAKAMGTVMPHRDDDVNELPDAVDSDMERR